MTMTGTPPASATELLQPLHNPSKIQGLAEAATGEPPVPATEQRRFGSGRQVPIAPGPLAPEIQDIGTVGTSG